MMITSLASSNYLSSTSTSSSYLTSLFICNCDCIFCKLSYDLLIFFVIYFVFKLMETIREEDSENVSTVLTENVSNQEPRIQSTSNENVLLAESSRPNERPKYQDLRSEFDGTKSKNSDLMPDLLRNDSQVSNHRFEADCQNYNLSQIKSNYSQYFNHDASNNNNNDFKSLTTPRNYGYPCSAKYQTVGHRRRKKLVPDLELKLSLEDDSDRDDDNDDESGLSGYMSLPFIPSSHHGGNVRSDSFDWTSNYEDKIQGSSYRTSGTKIGASSDGFDSMSTTASTSRASRSDSRSGAESLPPSFSTASSSSSGSQLKLTLNELKHIREAITKADIDNISGTKVLKSDLENGKVCFNCLKTKFSVLSLNLGSKCHLCSRHVCSKCLNTINLSDERLRSASIPIEMLEPSSRDGSRRWTSNRRRTRSECDPNLMSDGPRSLSVVQSRCHSVNTDRCLSSISDRFPSSSGVHDGRRSRSGNKELSWIQKVRSMSIDRGKNNLKVCSDCELFVSRSTPSPEFY